MSSDSEEDSDNIDFSVISNSIEIGGSMTEQIMNGINYGSSEVRNLLRKECDIIMECKVCRNLFRSFPNFVAHKRVYCKERIVDKQFDTVPVLSSTVVNEETIIVQPSSPVPSIETRSSKNAKSTCTTTLTEKLKSNSYDGQSRAFQLFSKASEKVEAEKLQTKVKTVVMTPIESNPNAMFMNVTNGETSQKENDEASSSMHRNSAKDSKLSDVEAKNAKLKESSKNEGIENLKTSSSMLRSILENRDNKTSQELMRPPAPKSTKVDSESQLNSKKPLLAQELLRPVQSNLGSELRSKLTVLSKQGLVHIGNLECLICGKKLGSKKSLSNHMTHTHSEKLIIFPCLFCNKKYNRLFGVTRHLKEYHGKSQKEIQKLTAKLKCVSYEEKVERKGHSDIDVKKKTTVKELSPAKNSTVSKSHNTRQVNKADIVEDSPGVFKCTGCKKVFWKKRRCKEHRRLCKVLNFPKLAETFSVHKRPKNKLQRMDSDSSSNEKGSLKDGELDLSRKDLPEEDMDVSDSRKEKKEQITAGKNSPKKSQDKNSAFQIQVKNNERFIQTRHSTAKLLEHKYMRTRFLDKRRSIVNQNVTKSLKKTGCSDENSPKSSNIRDVSPHAKNSPNRSSKASSPGKPGPAKLEQKERNSSADRNLFNLFDKNEKESGSRNQISDVIEERGRSRNRQSKDPGKQVNSRSLSGVRTVNKERRSSSMDSSRSRKSGGMEHSPDANSGQGSEKLEFPSKTITAEVKENHSFSEGYTKVRERPKHIFALQGRIMLDQSENNDNKDIEANKNHNDDSHNDSSEITESRSRRKQKMVVREIDEVDGATAGQAEGKQTSKGSYLQVQQEKVTVGNSNDEKITSGELNASQKGKEREVVQTKSNVKNSEFGNNDKNVNSEDLQNKKKTTSSKRNTDDTGKVTEANILSTSRRRRHKSVESGDSGQQMETNVKGINRKSTGGKSIDSKSPSKQCSSQVILVPKSSVVISGSQETLVSTTASKSSSKLKLVPLRTAIQGKKNNLLQIVANLGALSSGKSSTSIDVSNSDLNESVSKSDKSLSSASRRSLDSLTMHSHTAPKISKLKTSLPNSYSTKAETSGSKSKEISQAVSNKLKKQVEKSFHNKNLKELYIKKLSAASIPIKTVKSLERQKLLANYCHEDFIKNKDIVSIEEIWVDKKIGKPLEEVKSSTIMVRNPQTSSSKNNADRKIDKNLKPATNRMYVMEPTGMAKPKCLDSKHIESLVDSKELKCTHCNVTFASHGNLRRHAVRHLGWKRFKCRLCRFTSYNKSDCVTHMLRTHAEKCVLNSPSSFIIDLNKEASKARTEKKQKTLQRNLQSAKMEDKLKSRRFQSKRRFQRKMRKEKERNGSKEFPNMDEILKEEKSSETFVESNIGSLTKDEEITERSRKRKRSASLSGDPIKRERTKEEVNENKSSTTQKEKSASLEYTFSTEPLTESQIDELCDTMTSVSDTEVESAESSLSEGSQKLEPSVKTMASVLEWARNTKFVKNKGKITKQLSSPLKKVEESDSCCHKELSTSGNESGHKELSTCGNESGHKELSTSGNESGREIQMKDDNCVQSIDETVKPDELDPAVVELETGIKFEIEVNLE